MAFPFITAEQAAELVNNGDNVGFSGFTAAGTPKFVAPAIAAKAKKEHEAGRPFKINVFTGASTNDYIDGELARADAVNFRTPYQSCKDTRARLNAHEINYCDMHLSQLAQNLRYGFFGKMDMVVIEAGDVTDDGEILLGPGVGNIPSLAHLADKIVIELNEHIPAEIRGLHDIYMPLDPPYRREIPIYKPSDRIGKPYVEIPKSKVVGVVECNLPDEARAFKGSDPVTDQIGANVAAFLLNDMKRGVIPSCFLPLQSGVGSTANAILAALSKDQNIPDFNVYTEVLQDSIVDMMLTGRVKDASTCSLTVSNECLANIYDNIEMLKHRLTLRQSEISNSPEVIRRLGVIAINTAIEVDIFGNANSTHISGTKMMNGIGGSGDFERNAYISIFTCSSVAKGGLISSIVPFVSHQDHSEHDVNVIVTEQGVADLRGKSPMERAHLIIENCAHPDYRPLLRDYLKIATGGQTHHNLPCAFAFHDTLRRKGDMHLTDFAEYVK